MKLIAAKVAGISASQNFFKVTGTSIVIGMRDEILLVERKDWYDNTIETVSITRQDK